MGSGCRVEIKADREWGDVPNVHHEAKVIGHADVGTRVTEFACAISGQDPRTEVGVRIETADARHPRHVENAVKDVMRVIVIIPRM